MHPRHPARFEASGNGHVVALGLATPSSGVPLPWAATAHGTLARLQMVPTTMRRLSLRCAAEPDARWLQDMLSREGKAFGTRAELDTSGRLELR